MKIAYALAAVLLASASTASATVLVANTGWQDDEVGVLNGPSNLSPWEFTVTGSAVFSITDAYLVGDHYTLYSNGGVIASTSLFVGGGVQADGTFLGNAWANGRFEHLAYSVGPGSYSFTIKGNCGGGCPAGLGVRLDEVAVPEPGTWALMIAGFGLAGAALRRRREVLAA